MVQEIAFHLRCIVCLQKTFSNYLLRKFKYCSLYDAQFRKPWKIKVHFVSIATHCATLPQKLTFCYFEHSVIIKCAIRNGRNDQLSGDKLMSSLKYFQFFVKARQGEQKFNQRLIGN